MASKASDDSGDWIRVTNDDDVDRSEVFGRGLAPAPLAGRERKPPLRPGVEPRADDDERLVEAKDDERAPTAPFGDGGASRCMSETLDDICSDGAPDEPVGSSLVVDSPSPLSSRTLLLPPRPRSPPRPVPSLRAG
jgi:hypothetical protein